MDRSKIIIIGAVLIVIILLVFGGIYIKGKSSSGIDQKAQNTLSLAREYFSSEEFDMALNLINSLLIENADNDDARDLRDEIIKKKKELETSNKLLEEQRNKDALDAQDSLEQTLSDLGNTIGDSSTQVNSLSESQENERKAEELRKLEEQRLEAEKRRKEEEARLAALSQAERDKAEKVKELIKTGREKMGVEQHAQARGYFDEALDLDPESAVAYAETGESYFQEDENSQPNITKAVEYANRAIEKDKNLWIPYETLGKVYSKQNQWDSAVDAYKTAARLNPEKEELLFEMGKAQYRTRDYDGARQSFEACIHIEPNHEKAYMNLGFTQRRLGSSLSAFKAFENVSSINSQNASAFYQMGELKKISGDKNSAVKYYKEAVLLNPTNAIYHGSLAVAYSEQKNYKEAEKSYESALTLDSTNSVTNNNMALTKLFLNKPEEALIYAAAAVHLKPESAEYLYTLGNASEATGNIDSAVQAYTSALSRKSNYILPLINLGKIYD
ncbi:MAG: tetratricopeptide repeat protein [Spirochaetota bacterium]|nr:tetratricopeptide repeat protein [Spirochaetota bacterium]